MYVVMFTLHARAGHYAQLADTYSAFAAGFLSSHPALESVLVVGDEASGVLRGIGIYTDKDAADGVNSDPQFAAFNDSIAEMVATPPERVELELLHLFAAELSPTNEHATSARDRLDRNRAVWSAVNAQFTDGDADARWRAPDLRWGLFGIPEKELGLLGDIDGGIEHHLGHGEWIRVLHDAGLVVDALHELSPADGATPEYYDIATAEWATRWPAEDVRVARRS